MLWKPESKACAQIIFQYCKSDTILDSNMVEMENVRPLERFKTCIEFYQHVIIAERFVAVNVLAIVDDAIITLILLRPNRGRRSADFLQQHVLYWDRLDNFKGIAFYTANLEGGPAVDE